MVPCIGSKHFSAAICIGDLGGETNTDMKTYINDEEVLLEVTYYAAPKPMRITGSGFGDCDPPEPVEFEYKVLHPDGTPWPELDVSEEDDERIFEEFMKL